MKTVLIIVLALFAITISFAQSVVFSEVKESFPVGHVHALRYDVPYVSKKDLFSEWKTWLKNHNAIKIDEQNKILFADNVAIKEISSGTCDIYSKTIEDVGTIQHVVTIDYNGKYLCSEDEPEKYGVVRDLIKQFCVQQSTKAIEELLANESKKLNKLKNQQKDLQTDLTHYTEKIQTNTMKTNKAQNEFEYQNKVLLSSNETIEVQRKIVQSYTDMTSEIAKKEQKKYEKLRDNQLDTEKKIRNLSNDVVDFTNNIEKFKNLIIQNEKDQITKKNEIEIQQKVVEDHMAKVELVKKS